jgi:hypothetical protein
MDHEMPVSICNCCANHAEKLDALVDGQMVGGAITIERLSNDILHDQVRSAIASGSTIEEMRDIGMIKECENLALGVKSPLYFLVFQTWVQNFYCNLFFKCLVGARREVYRSHSTDAKQALDSVRSDSATVFKIAILLPVSDSEILSLNSRSSTFKKTVGLRGVRYEFVQFFSEICIFSTRQI